jgi:hypothetical protein
VAKSEATWILSEYSEGREANVDLPDLDLNPICK